MLSFGRCRALFILNLRFMQTFSQFDTNSYDPCLGFDETDFLIMILTVDI